MAFCWGRTKMTAQTPEAVSISGRNLPDKDLYPEAHSDAVMKIYGDGKPFRKARAARGVQMAQGNILQGYIDAGRWLICAKEHLPHGEFTEFVETFMDPRRARECMQLAYAYTDKLSPLCEVLNALGSISKSKALLVVNIPEHDIQMATQTNMLYGRDILALGDMSVREASKFISDGRREAHNKTQATQPGNTVALNTGTPQPPSTSDTSETDPIIKALSQTSASLGEAIEMLLGVDWFVDPDFFDTVESYIRRLDSQMATIYRLYAEAE